MASLLFVDNYFGGRISLKRTEHVSKCVDVKIVAFRVSSANKYNRRIKLFDIFNKKLPALCVLTPSRLM